MSRDAGEPPIQLAQRGPVFFAVTRAGNRVDARDAAVLQRRIALTLRDTSVSDALDVITHLSGLGITYDPRAVPRESHVTLGASDISVAAALTVVLLDAGLDVEMTGPMRAMLVPRAGLPSATAWRQPTPAGILAGRVTDSRAKEPLPGVAVLVSDTRLGTTTALDGSYRMAGVPVGSHTVTFRRLGYVATTRAVTVAADSTVRLDVPLIASAAMLDEVVTTMTGDQHLREIGNMVGTIAADSVAQTAAINSLSDVITARVPGVQVFLEGGLTAASPLINIRGQGSYNFNNQPLLYIDGVRVENNSSNTSASGGMTSFAGRFNDLLPDDIASIEIAKGPSAATLYGTDASSGVILVTTKRGSAGRPRWTVHVERGLSDVDESVFAPNEGAWGHSTDASHTLFQPGISPCTAVAVASGQCVQDSVTHFSPLLNSATTPFGIGDRADYGIQVAGGSAETRYFASGTYTSQIGYLKMPQTDLALLRAEREGAGVPGDEVRPNGEANYSGRANLTAQLTPNLDLTLSAGYLLQDARVPRSSAIAFAGLSPGYRDSADGWGFAIRPLNFFGVHNNEETNHFTGGATANWSVLPWLVLHGTLGLDNAATYADAYNLEGEGAPIGNNLGGRNDSKGIGYEYTAVGTAIATVPLVGQWQSSTALGGNLNRSISHFLSAIASPLLPGCITLACIDGSGATTGGAVLGQYAASELDHDAVVAGAFGEQTFSHSNSLYIKAGLRVDGASSFGSQYRAAAYPKASVSWAPSQEAFFPRNRVVTMVRLRAAYGETGTQPTGLPVTTESLNAAYVKGQLTIGAGLPSYPNPNLKPQRQREFEGGIDAEFWGGRVEMQLTRYVRRTADDFVSNTAPASLGEFAIPINAGTVRNAGYEALADVRVLDGHFVTWDISPNASFNKNTLLSLGPGTTIYNSIFGPEVKVGYPLYSWFQNHIASYAFFPNTHVVNPASIVLDTTQHLVGSAFPTTNVTLAQTVALVRLRIAFRAQVDYRGGFKALNFGQQEPCSVNACAAAVNANTPIRDQLSYAALSAGDFQRYVQDASFARLRELSASYTVSPRLAARLHAHSVLLTLAGRNLALWTRFHGTDPEAAGAAEAATPTAYYPGYVIPARYVTLRATLGF